MTHETPPSGDTPDTENHELEPFDWTSHPDAYPDLSNCPSCGEPVTLPWYDPFAEKPTEPVRCEQCDRDLRLPRDAIKAQLCLVCKVPSTEADPDIGYHRIETGERVCTNCIADLRSFKYELEVVTFAAEWITDEHRQALIAAQQEVADAFEQEYNFTANGNARYARMDPIPEEEREITLEALINGEVEAEDLPPELREKLDEGGDPDA